MQATSQEERRTEAGDQAGSFGSVLRHVKLWRRQVERYIKEDTAVPQEGLPHVVEECLTTIHGVTRGRQEG